MTKQSLYHGTSGESAASSFYVADLYAEADVYGASIYVQDASGLGNQFDLTLLDQAGMPIVSETYQIATSGSQPISIARLLADIDFAGDKPFVAHIDAEGSVAIGTVGCRHNLCTTGSGLTASSTRWFAPGLLSHSQTADPLEHYSTLTVINVEEEEAIVDVSYGADSASISYTLPPYGSLHLTTIDFPESFTGAEAVEVRSESQLLVSAQYLNFFDGQGAAYNAIASDQGDTELFLPRIVLSETVESIVYLQNLSAAPVEAQLSLYKQADVEGESTEPIMIFLPTLEPFEGRTLDIKEYLREKAESVWAGAMLIEGTAPIGAINLTTSNADPHWATGYRALSFGVVDSAE